MQTFIWIKRKFDGGGGGGGGDDDDDDCGGGGGGDDDDDDLVPHLSCLGDHSSHSLATSFSFP